jgi:hypothetical protein
MRFSAPPQPHTSTFSPLSLSLASIHAQLHIPSPENYSKLSPPRLLTGSGFPLNPFILHPEKSPNGLV